MHLSGIVGRNLSRKFLAYLFMFSFSLQIVFACEVSALDQARLIWLTRSGPLLQASDLAGKELNCIKVAGHLTIVREIDAAYVYVLDDERTFDRWTRTEAVFPFEFKRLIRSYIQNAEYDGKDTWLRFGNIKRFGRSEEIDDYLTLSRAQSYWSVIRWLDQPSYVKMFAKPVSPLLLQAIRASIENMALAFLTKQGMDARSSFLSFDIDSELAARIRISAAVTIGTGRRTILLEMPISCFDRPFAGWPRLLSRDL